MLFINKTIFCVPCFVWFLLTFKMWELFLSHTVLSQYLCLTKTKKFSQTVRHFDADRNFNFTSSWVTTWRRPRVGLLSLSGSSSLTCANYVDGELFTPPTTHTVGSYWANNYPTGYRTQQTLLQLIIRLLWNVHF